MQTRIIRLLLLGIWLLTIASAEVHAQANKPLPAAVTNSLGMKFVLIPAGEFLMGSDETPESLAKAYPQIDPKRFQLLSDEAPVHRVRITKAFYLGQHEVTVGQFKRFLDESGYIPESIVDGTGGYGFNPQYDPERSKHGDAFEGRLPKYSWRNPGFPQTDAHPVVNVTWSDAASLCAWLSKKEAKRYRLPTEAEWEYACRAGTRTRYSSGDDPKSLVKAANVFDSDAAKNWEKWRQFGLDSHDGFEFTAPVGSFAPNSFGLYDMHGNAWEWVSDWYGEKYYGQSPVNDPQGPADGGVRVRRGGSWHTWPFYVRSSYRNWNKPDTRYTLVGMRLVREAD